MVSQADILHQPFPELDADSTFCAQASAMGFLNIDDVISLPLAELLRKPGFTHHWFGELTELLFKYDLLTLLQPIPGKSRG